jgi:hypothetical protein
MSTFPITYPEKGGQGRVTQIFTIPMNEHRAFQKKNDQEPPTQILQAIELNKDNSVAVIVDLPSTAQTLRLKGFIHPFHLVLQI